ncbi:MAG: TIGR01777 family oxidoreductase [Kiloniellales bacterium]|nr:TIGR01777 family oxidoreductase [Kiloniellales bacterium]
MELVLYLFLVQAPLGAFDIVYHHEITERLTWRRAAVAELRLHAARNLFYVVIFFSLAWIEWRGIYAWLFAAVLVAEIGITLWDFLVEDRTRDLPGSERVLHSVLAIAYGAILAVLLPVVWGWAALPSGVAWVDRGWLSWVMTLYSGGVLFWGLRDHLRARALARRSPAARPNAARDLPARRSVLITGGTGFIGRRLSADLIAAGHRVTVVTRDKRKLRDVEGPVAAVDRLDQLDPELCFDAVVNLAGEPVANGRWTPKKKREILRSRLETTRDVVAFIARAKTRPPVLISASALGYYGFGADAAFDEDTEPRPSFGNEVCEAWEAAALEAEKLGVRVCCLRIGLVLSAEGGALGQMLLPFELGLGGPIGRGRQWMSWIHMDDMLGLILRALADERFAGPINATAPQPLRNRDFARALGRVLRRPAVLPLPARALRFALGEMAEELLLGGQRILPKRAEELGYRFRHPELEGALKDILR